MAGIIGVSIRVVFKVILIFLLIFPASAVRATATGKRGIAIAVRTGPGRPPHTIRLYDESHALVVGVSDYTAGWPDLENVPDEVEQIRNALSLHGFQVTTVLDPDSRRLKTAFEDFINRYGYDPQNRLLFFFSGHGYSRKNGRKAYLVPADAPDPRRNDRDFVRKALNMSQIITWAREIEAKHALFLFDSCFSGAIFKTKALPEYPPLITKLTARPVRQFITAGSAGEEVPARSVFVPSFIKALRGEADIDHDSYITGTELGMFLQRKVVHYNSAQTPQYGKIRDPDLDEGDFIFLAGGSSVYQEPVVRRSSRGTLKVETSPSGAVVSISGQERGRAPVTVKDISSGEVEVQARLSGYVPEGRQVRVRAGRTTRVKLFLDRVESKGRLYVTADPPDSMIKILNIGPRYHDGIELEAGRYHVEVSKSGYRTYDEWVDLGDGEDLDLPVKLEPVGRHHVASGSSMPLGKTWTESVTGMEFVWVPGGCFDMGQPDKERDALIKNYGRKEYDKYWDYERPVHRVCVDGFYMGKYEVTVKQWRQFISETGYKTDAEKDVGDKKGCYVFKDHKWGWQDGYFWDNPCFSQSGNQPVSCVSYRDVQAYIRWLNRKSGRGYRLPTEAEWEYAARAGTSTARYWGDEIDSKACQYANIADKAHNWQNYFPCDDGYKYSAPVGSYRPNSFGLYDMLGNVWEWCQDWYSSSYYSSSPSNNPSGPSSGSNRVNRGGSWDDWPGVVRSASRDRGGPAVRGSILGFRLALPPDQSGR